MEGDFAYGRGAYAGKSGGQRGMSRKEDVLDSPRSQPAAPRQSLLKRPMHLIE
jgi:hypothetical protein